MTRGWLATCRLGWDWKVKRKFVVKPKRKPPWRRTCLRKGTYSPFGRVDELPRSSIMRSLPQAERIVYIDGEAKPNPGDGCWGLVCKQGNEVVTNYGYIGPMEWAFDCELQALEEAVTEVKRNDNKYYRNVILTDCRQLTMCLYGRWQAPADSQMKLQKIHDKLCGLNSVPEVYWLRGFMNTELGSEAHALAVTGRGGTPSDAAKPDSAFSMAPSEALSQWQRQWDVYRKSHQIHMLSTICPVPWRLSPVWFRDLGQLPRRKRSALLQAVAERNMWSIENLKCECETSVERLSAHLLLDCEHHRIPREKMRSDLRAIFDPAAEVWPAELIYPMGSAERVACIMSAVAVFLASVVL